MDWSKRTVMDAGSISSLHQRMSLSGIRGKTQSLTEISPPSSVATPPNRSAASLSSAGVSPNRLISRVTGSWWMPARTLM